MSKLIPDYVFDSIYDITPEVLTAHGVRGVLVDLDGTMASHKAALPPETLYTFVDRLKNAGIAVLVFSNNHPERVGKFCEPLGVGYIQPCRKAVFARLPQGGKSAWPVHARDCRYRRPDFHRCVRRQPCRRADLLRRNARPPVLDQCALSA